MWIVNAKILFSLSKTNLAPPHPQALREWIWKCSILFRFRLFRWKCSILFRFRCCEVELIIHWIGIFRFRWGRWQNVQTPQKVWHQRKIEQKRWSFEGDSFMALIVLNFGAGWKSLEKFDTWRQVSWIQIWGNIYLTPEGRRLAGDKEAKQGWEIPKETLSKKYHWNIKRNIVKEILLKYQKKYCQRNIIEIPKEILPGKDLKAEKIQKKYLHILEMVTLPHCLIFLSDLINFQICQEGVAKPDWYINYRKYQLICDKWGRYLPPILGWGQRREGED